MIFIVVHRKRAYDMEMAMREFLDELYSLNPSFHIKLDRVKRRIELNHGSVRIGFYCGEYWRLAGIRVDGYSSDDYMASEILRISAEKVNGFRVSSDLKELAKMVCGLKSKEVRDETTD